MDLTIAELGLIRDEKARTESYFCNHANHVTIKKEHIAELKERLIKTGGHSIRISLHRTPHDLFHQMIIMFRQGGPVRAHKHLDKEESHHIIEGKLRVVIYNDDKRIAQTVILGEPGSGLPFLFRLRANVWHDTIPETEFVAFHECKSGPFKADESVFLEKNQ